MRGIAQDHLSVFFPEYVVAEAGGAGAFGAEGKQTGTFRGARLLDARDANERCD